MLKRWLPPRKTVADPGWVHDPDAADGFKPGLREAFPNAVLPSRALASGFAEAMERTSEFLGIQIKQPTRPAKEEAIDPPDAVFKSEGPQGHRERMRDRLIDRGPDGIADYELLEMLLFFAQPKGDTKPLAKRLINRFGSYAATLAAEPRLLSVVPGVGRATLAAIKLVQASSLRMALAEVKSRPVIANWDQLMAYLNAVLVHEPIEQFRVVFLDTRNQLLADEQQGRGTINHTPVYPREVAKRALELHAAAVILVHNHPSGDPSPSEDDVEMTMQVEAALKPLSVRLHDHVIVGNGRWLSLRKEQLI